MRRSSRLIATGGGLAALLAVFCALPFLVALYRLDILIFMLINVILAVSYRFLTLAGEFSLGHVVMMGVGAYGSALATKEAGLSVWLAAPLAAAFTGLLALLLAFPLFRMKGFYFLIGSFAAGEAIRLTWNRSRDPFGGPGGIVYIPSPEIPLPVLGMFDVAADARAYYFLTLAIVIITIFIFYRLEHSRFGLTLHAIHWKDVLAESVGVHIWWYKTFALVVASAFAGLAGGLLGHYLGTVNPTPVQPAHHALRAGVGDRWRHADHRRPHRGRRGADGCRPRAAQPRRMAAAVLRRDPDSDRDVPSGRAREPAASGQGVVGVGAARAPAAGQRR